jgi:uncharacterized membrane protein YfcA
MNRPMPLTVFSFLALAVFFTSLLSGVFGMMGGMVLMVILLGIMPVSAAMAVHAAVQLVSNGWRCILWRRHIVWHVLPWYIVGIACGITLLAMLRYVPDKNSALILMGSLPLFSLLAERFVRLSIQNRLHTVISSTILTFIHLTAGVVGPLLDLLYVNAPLTRQQIIATKAFTQSVMHVVRLVYFGALVAMVTGADGWPEEIGPLWMALLCAASVAGTSAAAFIVQRISDKRFKTISRILIALISLYCLYQGITGKLGL